MIEEGGRRGGFNTDSPNRVEGVVVPRYAKNEIDYALTGLFAISFHSSELPRLNLLGLFFWPPLMSVLSFCIFPLLLISNWIYSKKIIQSNSHVIDGIYIFNLKIMLYNVILLCHADYR